eukprot:3061887-Pleurochrysis_carterae.AAC.1
MEAAALRERQSQERIAELESELRAAKKARVAAETECARRFVVADELRLLREKEKRKVASV